MGALQFHPLANIFPLIEGDEFKALVDDVREHGVREPAWLYDGAILDGRNRYRAAQAAGVDCPTRAFDGADPVAFVVSLNLKRRHLSESQRAMVAAKLANLSHGGDRKSDQPANLPLDPTPTLPAPVAPVSQPAAAQMLNVSERSVRAAVMAGDRSSRPAKANCDVGDPRAGGAEKDRRVMASPSHPPLRCPQRRGARQPVLRRRAPPLVSFAGASPPPPAIRWPSTSELPMRQSSTFDPTTVGARVTAFLRAAHPTKPALAVAAVTGAVTPAQADKWFARQSAPSGGALLALIRAYGPAFLASLFDDAPAWVREAERAQMQDELERSLAETRAKLDALRERA